MNNPAPGNLMKTRPNGDQLFYDPGNNIFAVRDSNCAPRTMFRPRDGLRYWLRQR